MADKDNYNLSNQDEPSPHSLLSELREKLETANRVDIKIELRQEQITISVMAGGKWTDLPRKFVVALKHILNLPKPIGRFVFDILGRHDIADSSSIILGWIVVLMTLLLFRGLIPLDLLINWLVGLGNSFLR